MSTMRNSPQSLMMIVATVSPADIEMTLIKVVAHYRSTQPNMKSSFIDATAGMMPYACDAETPLKKKKKGKNAGIRELRNKVAACCEERRFVGDDLVLLFLVDDFVLRHSYLM